MTTTTRNKAFDTWFAKVDRRVQAIAGLGAFDLADIAYFDLFEAGVSPSAAAREALENEGFPFGEDE